jgi:preprotein translocase subunit YajC
MLKAIVSQVLAETPPPAAQASPFGGFFIPMMVMMMVFFFVVVWYPESKRKKAHQEMLLKLKSGDRVLLANGMRGTVAQVRDSVVVVEIAPKVPVEFERSVVAAILVDDAVGEKK